MQGYWLQFTDGTRGYCEGQTAFEAVQIAEHITGRKVDVGDHRWDPKLTRLPYPAAPVIWQYVRPGGVACPTFCGADRKCWNKSSCPQNYACSE